MSKMTEHDTNITTATRMPLGLLGNIVQQLVSGVVVAVVAYFTLVGQISSQREAFTKELAAQREAIMVEADRRYVSREVSEARYQTAVLTTQQSIEYLRRDMDDVRRALREMALEKPK